MLSVEHRLERPERRVQPEKSIQIDGRVGCAIRFGDPDGGAQRVIARLSKRNHHVQSVHRAALEDRDQYLLAAFGRVGGIEGAREPRRHGADAEHRERRAFQEYTSGWHFATSSPVLTASENPATRLLPRQPSLDFFAFGLPKLCQ